MNRKAITIFIFVIFIICGNLPLISQELLASFEIGIDIDKEPYFTYGANLLFIGNNGFSLSLQKRFFVHEIYYHELSPLFGIGYVYYNHNPFFDNLFYVGGMLNFSWGSGLFMLAPTIVGGYDFGDFILSGQLSYVIGGDSNSFRLLIGAGFNISSIFGNGINIGNGIYRRSENSRITNSGNLYNISENQRNSTVQPREENQPYESISIPVLSEPDLLQQTSDQQLSQDLIIMKNGNIIEAKILEISPSEIRYKRIEHLDGPTIVILAADVLSVRYENGRQEIINAVPAAGQTAQAKNSQNTAIDPNKFIFGINANAGGFIGNILGGGVGPGFNIELGKGKFNSEINIMFPNGGFGILATFNGFFPSRIGGFYIGGGIGFSFYEGEYYDYHYRRYEIGTIVAIPLGLNIGYKFVTKSGLFFRTGAFAGYNPANPSFYFKPDLAVGWTMR